jgi:hypothetical protein
MPPTDPIRLYQRLAPHRHGPVAFRAALALQLAWLRLQLALCAALLLHCPPLGPWAYRRVVALTAAELPHGEYLPWVQQACGLKPRYAQQLIKAAEWVNAQHAAHLDAVPDATTLFLLSADTTPEEVREWFMERCAAGDPPSRKEVQERKRAAGSQRSGRAMRLCA